MRARQLAMRLSRLPAHPQTSVDLEQYATSGDLAARWLIHAAQLGDIEGRRVVDLGAGNGILGLAAALLGAAHVTLVEQDPTALNAAAAAARSLGLAPTRVTGWSDPRAPGSPTLIEATMTAHWPDGLPAETILMNPPWGVQTPRADRPFLKAALASPVRVIHLLHSDAAAHPEALARAAGWHTEDLFIADLLLPAAYTHHTRRHHPTRVRIRRFSRPD